MNNYNFTQTLDGLNSIDASSISTDSLDVDNFIANTATITTLSNSNLVNCQTSTTPSIPNSIVNKSYVDDNFVDKTTNQSINGLKLFLNKLEVYNTASNASLTLRVSSGTSQQSTISQNGSSLQFLNNSTTPTITYLISGATRLTISPTQFLLDSSCFLTTNDIKSRLPTGTHSLLSDISTGSLTISSSTASNTINGSTSFTSIPLCSISATTANQLVNFTTLNAQGFTTLPLVQANNNVWTGTNTFNTNLPTSTLTPSAPSQLITKTYADGTFIDFITNQDISGNKNFTNITNTRVLYTKDFRWFDAGGSGNIQQIYLTGVTLVYVPLFNSNQYSFQCRDSGSTTTTPLIISSSSTTISNNLIITGEGTFNTWLNLNFRTRIYDLNGLGNYTQMYMIGGNEFVIGPNANGDKISFYCKDSITGTQTNTFFSSSLSNTSNAPFICNGTATFNSSTTFNTSLPTSTLTPSAPTQLTTKAYVDGMPVHQILNTNNTWTGTNTYNTYLPTSTLTPSSGQQLITKTYVDSNFIDFTTNQTVSGNKDFTNITSTRVLYTKDFRLYDAGGGSNIQQIFLSGTNLSFLPLFNNNQYSFQCKDSVANLTTPLTITSSSTTIQNNLISNAQTTFNTVAPISNVTSTLNEHLTRKDYCDNNFMYKINNVVESINGWKTFMNRVDLNGGTALVVGTGTSYFNGTAGFGSLATFNAGAIFNTIIPTTSITATSANELVNFTTLNAQSFVKATSNTTFSGFNTFSNGLTIKSTLELKDITNTQSGIIDMGGGGILVISSNNNSGKIQINTYDSGGSSYNRLIIDENECNLTVPVTLNLDYTYYNPFNFTSTRLGYITSNTGSTTTLTTGTGSNSGQLNLPAGSWNICYTATITVITNTLTTLNSLEVFLADSFNADLNIIGLDVLNYYKISTISIGQKFKISASGNLTSYSNTNTQYNLRLIPNFVAGSGGLNFQGSISATRNA